MFGDIPSGWAFGRMGRPAMRRPNPYSGLVDGLSAGELEADLVPVVHADLRSGPARVQLFARTPIWTCPEIVLNRPRPAYSSR